MPSSPKALKDGDTITIDGHFAREGVTGTLTRWWTRRPRALQEYQLVEPQAIQPVVVVRARRAYCTVTKIGPGEWHSVCGAGNGREAPSGGSVRVVTGHWVSVKEV